jgi:GT2 family glycosyltransferase
MSKPTVSVIIPVFNGLSFTRKSLANLAMHRQKLVGEDHKIEIIIVDDGSTDGTAQWVTNNYPQVHLLQGNGNLWWSGGINKGITYALEHLHSDYILWWNNDIWCEDDYFSNLFLLLEQNPAAHLIGSKILRLHDKRVWGMGGRFDPRSGKKYMVGERQADGEQYQHSFEVDWFPGMGTCIHNSVFESIGLLDEENFPQYHGDSDFTFRARKAGFKLIAHPSLVIYNDVSNTGIQHNNSFGKLYQSLTGLKSNYNIRKNILFLRKHSASPKAYLPLVKKYCNYIGGFLKWKALNGLGIKKRLH